MLKTVKIKDNLYVNILPVEVPKATPVAPSKTLRIEDEDATNQFLILDRSGSMYHYLPEVVKHVKEYVATLPEGSTVSVGYFSGTGSYNLSVPYTLKKELSGLVTTLDTYRTSLGMTNFVEILNKLNSVVGNKKASLFFFTDGCHNQGGSRADIEKALRTWSNSSTVSVFVGHGYIDRDTMSWMASITNGSFVHLNSFGDFKSTLEDFGTSVADSVPTIDVAFPYAGTNAAVLLPISMSGKNILEYEVEKGVVKFKPSKKGYKGLFFVSDSTRGLGVAQEVIPADLTKTEQATFANAVRALAYVHSQKTNVDTALGLLDYLGDKYLLRNLFNSVTPEEFSQAETLIRRSVFQTKARFLEGETHGFLPDPNAFCVLDAINALMKDDGVLIHLNDPDFEYTKIGKSTAQLDGSYLTYPDDLSASFNKVVMHKDRLNVSLSTAATAAVALDPTKFTKNTFTYDDLKRLGINPVFPVSVFRTYSIIADGKVQTKKVVLSNLSKETVNALSAIITKRVDGKYVVDFSSLPVLNKSYITLTSGKALAEKVWEEKVLMDELSVLNYLKKAIEEKEGKALKNTMGLSDEAAKFLLEHCYIKNGLYNPPKELVDATDEYEAYTFSIDFEGYSKASASEVIKKLVAGKTASVRESILEEVYNEKKNAGLDTLDFLIKSANLALSKVREFIQASKFAIILGNRGKMDEFTSRENMSLSVDVKNFSGKPLTVKAIFTIGKETIKL